MDDEQYMECYIPQNYKGVISILQLAVKQRNLIEGAVIGVIIAFCVFQGFRIYNYGITGTGIGFTIVGFIAGLIIGVIGINGEPVSQFIIHLFRFLRKRRTVYYNPRVKVEIKPSYIISEESQETVLPRDKIIAGMKKVREKFNSINSSEKTIQTDEFNAEYFEFEDDIAAVPEEKMTASQRRALNKEKKRAERELKKKQREEAKLNGRKGKKKKEAAGKK